jgi:hypothetical protein
MWKLARPLSTVRSWRICEVITEENSDFYASLFKKLQFQGWLSIESADAYRFIFSDVND